MGLALNIIMLVVAGLAYAISGGFATNAAKRTADIPGYSGNNKLTQAHRWLSIAAVVTWVSIALIVLGIILMIFFLPEEGAAEAAVAQGGSSFGKIILYGLLFLIMGGIIAVGILSAIAANDIGNSGVPDDNMARRQAIIAASIAIPVFVLLLIVLIVTFTYKPKKKESESTWLATEFGGV